MAQRKSDELLDEYLRGDSSLSRAYREAGREEPPARLDAAILAQAKGEPVAHRGGRPRWLMPLSLAATVLLSVGIVLFMTRQGATPVPMETAPVTEPAPAVKPPAPAERPVATPRVAPREIPAAAPKAPVVTPKEAPRFEARDVVIPPKKPPEQWLAEIEALRRQGKNAEADAELAKFRQRYPDYPLKPGAR